MRFVKWWREQNKFAIAMITIFIICFVYIGTNRIEPIFERLAIPFLFGEEKIPLILWTIPLYISIFIVPITMILILPKPLYHNTALTLVIMTFIHGLFFFFLPTQYPREYNPIDSNEFLSWVYLNAIYLDNPQNCFPSMHVSIPFLTAFVWFKKNKPIGAILFIWSIGIWITTITTKQHYILDGAGSLLLAFIIYKTIYKKLCRLQ